MAGGGGGGGGGRGRKELSNNGLVQLEGRWKAFTLMSRRFHLGFVWDGVRLGGGGGRGGNGWPECSNYSCFIVSKRF
jgi:hypothetical protein